MRAESKKRGVILLACAALSLPLSAAAERVPMLLGWARAETVINVECEGRPWCVRESQDGVCVIYAPDPPLENKKFRVDQWTHLGAGAYSCFTRSEKLRRVKYDGQVQLVVWVNDSQTVITKTCLAIFKKEVLKQHTVLGCARVIGMLGIVYAPEDLRVIGHEVKHIFDGDFHDD